MKTKLTLSFLLALFCTLGIFSPSHAQSKVFLEGSGTLFNETFGGVKYVSPDYTKWYYARPQNYFNENNFELEMIVRLNSSESIAKLSMGDDDGEAFHLYLAGSGHFKVLETDIGTTKTMRSWELLDHFDLNRNHTIAIRRSGNLIHFIVNDYIIYTDEENRIDDSDFGYKIYNGSADLDNLKIVRL